MRHSANEERVLFEGYQTAAFAPLPKVQMSSRDSTSHHQEMGEFAQA